MKYLILSILIVITSCDAIGTFEAEEISDKKPASAIRIPFLGITEYNITSSDKIVLNWQPPEVSDKTNLQYEIYMDVRNESISDVTKNSVAVENASLSLNSFFDYFSLAQDEVSEGTFWNLEDSLLPSKNTSPLAQIGSSRFYQVDEEIYPGMTYLFEVRIKNHPEVIDEKNQSLIYRSQTIEEQIGDYTGCISAQSQSTSSILVDFTFPEEAEKMTILQNGQEVYSTTDKTLSSYLDWALIRGSNMNTNVKLP